jgi:DNA mismatch endonuclease (patch repair protein)
MDNLTPEQRRKNMQNIHSKWTKTERLVASELKKHKIYFAAHVKKIIGNPDFVFRRKKVVVFIDSDFWHGHPERFIMPKSNLEYWAKKIEHNRKRDQEVTMQLEKAGWKVIRIWEKDLKQNFLKCFNQILKALDVLS